MDFACNTDNHDNSRDKHDPYNEVPVSDIECTDQSFIGTTIPTKLDTIDHILSELAAPTERVRNVGLTINGAEYETLKGMTDLLKSSCNLSLTGVAGREQEERGGGYIGYVDGRPDHKVIGEFLQKFGFRTRLQRFHRGRFGFLVAAKGSQPYFM
jgi:hypothetical protein